MIIGGEGRIVRKREGVRVVGEVDPGRVVDVYIYCKDFIVAYRTSSSCGKQSY